MRVREDEFKSDPILIDPQLTPVDFNNIQIHSQMAPTFNKLFPDLVKPKIIESTVPEPSPRQYLHRNLMHYLMLAWTNHFSVVLSPDMLFYTILAEISDEILTHPDIYRHLFTDSLDKKEILTLTHDVTKIDLEQVIAGKHIKLKILPNIVIEEGHFFIT